MKREEVCLRSKIKDASEAFALVHQRIEKMIEENSFQDHLGEYPSHQEIEKLCQRLFSNTEKQRDIEERLESY